MLGVLVVIQSTTGRPPLQLKLSSIRSSIRHTMRQGPFKALALGWYLDRSQGAALRFEVAFGEAIEAIRVHPTTFPMCDGVHRFVLLKR